MRSSTQLRRLKNEFGYVFLAVFFFPFYPHFALLMSNWLEHGRFLRFATAVYCPPGLGSLSTTRTRLCISDSDRADQSRCSNACL